MDKQKELKRAKEWYEGSVKKIGLADKLVKKIKPLLPDGWIIQFGANDTYPIHLVKGSYFSEGKKAKPKIEEFKLVCKVVEKITGKKASHDLYGKEETGIQYFEGRVICGVENIDLSIKIIIYNPDHSCDVTYEKQTIEVAKVSDDCFGLGGE